jgi:hypothetical protein
MATYKLDDNVEESAVHFTTKLSLPKFIAVSTLLNTNQRDLVKSIGFHHLLDLRCKSIPKGLILWLIQHFDVRTRTVNLPSGSSFILSSLQIHQVLGIPIGGAPLPSFCDESAKKLIRAETKCKGTYPTINELMALITDNLDGDKFKRIFALFTLSALLCPTSNECASPEFFQAVHMPDKIISYNCSDIVLGKLVSSISKFQQSIMSCNTAALGGCIFVLMVSLFPLTISSITISLCTIVFSSDIQSHTHLKYGCQYWRDPLFVLYFG